MSTLTAQNNEKKTVAILGAGVGGLTAGRLLARAGYQVLVFEKSDIWGGLAATKSYKDFRYDLGPHNIHTPYRHIVQFYKKNFPDFFEHNLTCHILKAKKLIEYPLKGIRVILSLKKTAIPLAILSFFTARLRFFLRTPKLDDTYEVWIRNRFGGVLFNEYFKDYAKKVWCIEVNQIDKYVGEKRVPVISITDLIRSVIFKQRAQTVHEELQIKNYYLKNGIGDLSHFLAADIKKHGGQIFLNSDITSIQTDNQKITGLQCVVDGQDLSIESDYMLSTIPIPDFINLMGTSVPNEVAESARELDYCSCVLVFVELKKRKYFPSAMLYFSDKGVKISRCYDVGEYSDAMVTNDRTLICCEVPCRLGDDFWNLSADQQVQHVSEVLIQNKLVSPGEFFGGFVEKITHSYPRFKIHFRNRLKTVFSFFSNFENFISYGRQGGFAYVNTDAVIRHGEVAASAILCATPYDNTCAEIYSMNIDSFYK